MPSNSAIPSRVPLGPSVAPRQRTLDATRRIRPNASARDGARLESPGSLNDTAGMSPESEDLDARRPQFDFSETGAPTHIEFWTIREVESAVKLKKSAIYARISRGAFPPPVKLSSTVSVWIESEVRTWMRNAALIRRRPDCANDVARDTAREASAWVPRDARMRARPAS
jgi:predicted DNA-binding transcriptional regulator AlpA